MGDRPLSAVLSFLFRLSYVGVITASLIVPLTFIYFGDRVNVLADALRQADDEHEHDTRNLADDTRPIDAYTYRSHYCGRLGREHVGQRVDLRGWLQFRRGTFIVVRDTHGTVQGLAGEHLSAEGIALLDKAPLESVLRMRGIVRARPDANVNGRMATGAVEVAIDELDVVGAVTQPLPFTIGRASTDVKDEQPRMKYRYIDLRRPSMQDVLRQRARIVRDMREYLTTHASCLEVETPTLHRRTPGGAREFVVPSSHRLGHAYSLVQSPQQFKQLLMVAGVDRYFQVARCYRDEQLTPERQPEFTQLDMELSFADARHVQQLVEDTLAASWPIDSPLPPPDFAKPIPRMTYADAMRDYGVDKPDTRFDMRIQVHDAPTPTLAISTSHAITKKTMAACVATMASRPYTCEARLVLDPDRHSATKVNTIVMTGDNEADVRRYAGQMRLTLANELEAKGVSVRTPTANLLWVIDFPLFESIVEEDGSTTYASSHHPFTRPIQAHVERLQTRSSWSSITGEHYDLVLNGSEIGGGSVRVHEADMQRTILHDVLDMPRDDQLAHVLRALETGAPPHAGFALGLDRFVALVMGARSIRDVMAFPKSSDGVDVMSGAPIALDRQQMRDYGIQSFLEPVPSECAPSSE